MYFLDFIGINWGEQVAPTLLDTVVNAFWKEEFPEGLGVGECIIWPFSTGNSPYGICKHKGFVLVHRFVFFRYHWYKLGAILKKVYNESDDEMRGRIQKLDLKLKIMANDIRGRENQQHYGEFLQVNHKCKPVAQSLCINPRHLELATPSSNWKDHVENKKYIEAVMESEEVLGVRLFEDG